MRYEGVLPTCHTATLRKRQRLQNCLGFVNRRFRTNDRYIYHLLEVSLGGRRNTQKQGHSGFEQV